jgi:hypothetical protein
VGGAGSSTSQPSGRRLRFGGGARHFIGLWLARIDVRGRCHLIPLDAEPRYTAEPMVRPVSGLTGPVELPIAFDREGGR